MHLHLTALVQAADISSAFSNLTTLITGYLAPVVGFALAVLGYMYITALDDYQRAAHIKRAIGMVIVGAIIVAIAATASTELVNNIKR
ncbi:TrbC/VirB2 family protein [Ktedonobacter robiniae]|uniref:Conjugal transfer protein TrbC n=1 Tax=Ktedonobacter robiniae TaxID=2778365 RepID=A0ABQ3V2L8_9CHLR|nr:TrbC/VirB2 family protein [Ktedonobacter robiniae]GHO59206.1 hypothetical protein KSB_76810 [Ktedonobacter robiniae]